MVLEPTCRHCVAGCRLFKQCRNLSAGTVLQRCRLFKWCQNLSAGTFCVQKEKEKEGCLSSIGTYLPALCCRLFKRCWKLSAGTVFRKRERERMRERRLFKRCLILPESTMLQWCRLFKRCGNLSAGNVLQGAGCLRGVGTYLPALCSKRERERSLFKGCGNLSASTALQWCRLFKRCRNLSAGTVLQ